MLLDHEWQIPVSSERHLAHYFVHTDCHVWTVALCGIKVNPAFAENGDTAVRCKNCERKLDAQT